MAAFNTNPFTAMSMVSGISSLSKKAWKLGTALSNLCHEAADIDIAINRLKEEVNSLRIECDLVYARLRMITSKNWKDPSLRHDLNHKIWDSLEIQVGEAGQIMQDLDEYVTRVISEQSGPLGQAQQQTNPNEEGNQIARIRSSICRCTNSLHTVLLLMDT